MHGHPSARASGGQLRLRDRSSGSTPCCSTRWRGPAGQPTACSAPPRLSRRPNAFRCRAAHAETSGPSAFCARSTTSLPRWTNWLGCSLRTGELGLLVHLRTVPHLSDEPAENHFPSLDELDPVVAAAGLSTMGSIAFDELPQAPPEWQAQTDEVDQWIERQHGTEPAWRAGMKVSSRSVT